MPPKASYWKHFDRLGNKAHCLLGGCKTPIVSLGKEPRVGEKKQQTGNYECLYVVIHSVILM